MSGGVEGVMQKTWVPLLGVLPISCFSYYAAPPKRTVEANVQLIDWLISKKQNLKSAIIAHFDQ